MLIKIIFFFLKTRKNLEYKQQDGYFFTMTSQKQRLKGGFQRVSALQAAHTAEELLKYSNVFTK